MSPTPRDDGWAAQPAVGRGGAEVLESPRSEGAPGLGERWSAQPLGRQRAVKIPLALLAVFLLSGVAVSEARGWFVERELRDAVSVSGRIRLVASSTTPAGGSVDYYLAVRNEGSRPIDIREVRIESPRLHVTSRDPRVLAIEPGATRSVALSALLDCGSGEAFDREAPLEGTVAAIPRSGREREVTVAVQQAALLTDAANTLCTIRPDLAGKEISGPILPQ